MNKRFNEEAKEDKQVRMNAQKSKLEQHLANMQQAEEYIAKRALEHQRLALTSSEEYRRQMHQVNVLE